MPTNCESQLSSGPAIVPDWIEHALEPGYYRKAIGEMMTDVEASLNSIKKIPNDQRTFENTVLAADSVLDRFNARGVTLNTIAYLVKFNDDQALAAGEFDSTYKGGQARIQSDSELLAAITATTVAPGVQTELKNALMRRLKHGGATLSADVRAKIASLVEKGGAIYARFRTATQNDPSAVMLSEPDVEGLDAKFLKDFVQTDGGYLLPIKDPGVVREFLTKSRSERGRQKVFIAYRSRLPENAGRLLEITKINAEIAQLLAPALGKEKATWLDKMITDRSMAGGYQQVEKLLLDLKKGFQPVIKNHLATMASLKAKDSSNPLATSDWFYYDNLVSASQSQTSDEDLETLGASYFPARDFLGMYFAYLNKTLRITFEEVPNAKVWDSSVKLFRVRDDRADGRTVGYIYFDMYSRDGKNASTAFVEELVSRRKLEDGSERLPVAALVCNWGKFTERETLNVSLGDVQTTLHEMGHALHAMFQQGSYYAISGWAHPTDYMEVPSTSLDKQFKNPDLLVALSGGKMPRDLAEKIANAERGFQFTNGDFFSSSHMMNTVFLSLLDIELQKNIGSIQTVDDMHALYRRYFTEFFGVDPGPNDKFIQTFHHIAGEYAGYYSSYINAGVAAANVVGRLEELGGVTNADAMNVWRRRLLEIPAYDKTAKAIMEDFLGHEISAEPVFRDQGLR